MGDDLFGSMSISASGMSAQRKRMDAIARNIANAETTPAGKGEVYKRHFVEVTSAEAGKARKSRAASHTIRLEKTSSRHLPGTARRLASGADNAPVVRAQEKVDADAGFTYVYEPAHPQADENGYIKVPDINTVTEMVDMVAATRAYEANLAAMKAYKSMFNKSLEI